MVPRDVVGALAKVTAEFNSQLSSSRTGSLAQIWMPEAGEDGSIVLNTQGLPYSINGVGDLLALFRCISCKYKFSTDITKTHQMGAVGRVFTSGEPEMSGHVQRYEQHVYLRAAEAQRCRVHSTLFMPIFASAARDACLAVFEVVLTDADVNFAGMVAWIISCLQSEGLYTAEVDTSGMQNQRLGLRALGATEYDGVSALESGVATRHGPGGAGAMRLGAADDGVSERGAGGGGSTLHLHAGGEAPGPAGSDDARGAKRPRGDGSSGGRPGGSGAGAEGLPSPAPQQQHMAAANGSGSGGGSGAALQQQLQLQRQGSHRGSGSLEGRPPLPNGFAAMAGGTPALNGSGHHSGSGGGLPSASTAQAGQPADAAPLVPLVAAAVQQLLSQGSPGLQLAALLGAHAVQQPPVLPSPLPVALPQLQPQQFGSAAGAGAGSSGGRPLMAGPSPAATGQPPQQQPPQQQQPQPPGEGGEGEEDDETDDEDRPFLRPAPGAAQKYGQGNRILTYDDLAAQFGYGLKEAAARLNICPTTLKRACRRLGIPRWPRRELVKHKRQRQARGDGGAGGSAPPPANGSHAKGPGFSTGSGPPSAPSAPSAPSGVSGNPQLMLAAAAAAASQQQPQQQLPRAPSGSLLAGLQGLQGLQGLEQLLPQQQGGGALPPELAAALAAGLGQQAAAGQAGAQQGGPPPPANPALVGQVMQLLQQHQQPPAWQQPGLPPMHPPQQHRGALGHGGLPAALALAHHAGLGGPPQPQPRASPVPPAPLLSNLGLPRRADSKLQSLGAGMGSLDILAAADLDMSVGNISVGNSPRIALSGMGGLSNLGLSGLDYGGAMAGGGGGPAATATGGATGPHADPAFSTGAMQPADK